MASRSEVEVASIRQTFWESFCGHLPLAIRYDYLSRQNGDGVGIPTESEYMKSGMRWVSF